jgi:hypothetical protein
LGKIWDLSFVVTKMKRFRTKRLKKYEKLNSHRTSSLEQSHPIEILAGVRRVMAVPRLQSAGRDKLYSKLKHPVLQIMHRTSSGNFRVSPVPSGKKGL